MATLRQKKLAREIVERSRDKTRVTKKDLAVNSGYSVKHAESHPEVIFNAPGVQNELKALGFSEENAKKVVSEILLDDEIEPSDRLKAADQVFKVHGSYAPEKRMNVNVDVAQLAESIRDQIAQFRGLTKPSNEEVNG